MEKRLMASHILSVFISTPYCLFYLYADSYQYATLTSGMLLLLLFIYWCKTPKHQIKISQLDKNRQ